MKIKYFLLFLIPFFVIFLNLKLLIFDYDFYNYNNKDVNENLLSYLNNKEELKFNYTTKELIHLEDVKSLVNTLNFIVYALGLLIILFLVFNKNDISDVLIISGIIIIVVIAVLFLIDFDFLFTKFHKISFTNNYWLLDENTLLIKTYPIEFFTEFFKRLVLNITITSLIVIGFGILKNVHKQYKSRAG
ncbi:MAG: DUF1461 domain-containing protein [Nanoarchaeota archaeon]